MPRLTISLTDETHSRLLRYIEKKYGKNRRVHSVIIEEALKRFLDESEDDEPG